MIRIERLLPAPPRVVFDAWTDPVSMSRWLSPVGHADVTADVRPDGRFTVVMVDGDTRIEHRGVYLAVEPPHLLRFTWESPYTGGTPSVVMVELHPHDDGTRLVLSHEDLPADTEAAHEGGWTTILDRLAGELSGGRR